MTRLRSLASLTLLVAFEALAFVALSRAGQVESWHVDWSNLGTWWSATPPADAIVGLLRYVGLVGVAYLGATTALYVLVAITRAPRLIRAAGIITIPGVRRLVESGMAVSVLAGAVATSAGPALAQEPAGGWVPNRPAVAGVVAPSQTAPAPAVEPTATDPGQWTTAQGDNYWDIAAEAIAHQRGVDVDTLRAAEIVPYWQTLIDASRSGNSSGDPNLIFAGEVQTLPPLASAQPAAVVATPPPVVPAPAPEPEPVAPAPVADEAPPATVAAPASPADEAVDEGTSAALTAPEPTVQEPAPTAVPRPESVEAEQGGFPLGLAGLTLVCTGIVAEVWRRRRRAERKRHPDEAQPPLTPEQEVVEMAATVGADPIGADFVGLGLRAFAGACLATDPDSPLPVPLGVLVSDDALEILLVDPCPVPAGQSVVAANGSRWVIERHVDRAALEEMADDCPNPLPGLVSLGRTGSGAQVMLDTEEAMLVTVQGEGSAELVIAAGLGLALPAFPSFASVVLVGMDIEPPTDRVRVVESLEEILPELEQRAERAADVVRAAKCGSTFESRVLADTVTTDDEGNEHRLVEDTEPLIPVIVVCPFTPAPHLAQRLVGLVTSAEAVGVAAIVAGEVDGAPWSYRISGGSLHVDQLGVDVDEPAAIPASMASTIGELLAAASAEPVPVPAEELEAREDAGESGKPEVVVRVLGPIGVDGPHGPITFARSRSLELAVVMVLNRDRQIDSDFLVSRLWPRSDNVKASKNTLTPTLWGMRQAVGYQHFPTCEGSQYLYQVADSIVSDLAMVTDAYRRSSTLDPDEARGLLADALGWVRGEPFTHATKDGYDWASQTARDAARWVVDAAHRLCELSLEAGELEQAWWATDQGLLASPGHEQMYRDRGRIQSARGDSVDAISATLDEALSHTDPDDMVALDPATTKLFAELTAVG